MHSTMNTSASGQSVLADSTAAEARKLKEATIQANVKNDQLRLDLGQLITSVTAQKWTHAEDHIVTMGMKSCNTWREQHATISKKLIEVEGLAKLHDLTDLQGHIANTRSEITSLSTRMNVIILDIETADSKQGISSDRMTKACPIKLPSYSGEIREDFIAFKDKFHKAAVDNKISRRDRVEKLSASPVGPQPTSL